MVKSVSDWAMEMIKRGCGLPPLSSAKIKFKMDKDNNLLTAQDARTLSIDGEINSSSVIRKKYNYCKHKGKPAYDEIEELRGKRKIVRYFYSSS